MAAFNRTFRQKVVDEYLNDTGSNYFEPRAFLDWLQGKPEHAVYPIFFGKSDEEAALQYRLIQARQFVSGLRVKITMTPAMASSTQHIAIKIKEPTPFRIPAFVSPVSGRRQGGGYYQTDVTDEDSAKELYRQAAQGLSAWLERYGDVARLAGADVKAIEAVLGSLTVAGTVEEEDADAA
jgi:hypothetical protein